MWFENRLRKRFFLFLRHIFPWYTVLWRNPHLGKEPTFVKTVKKCIVISKQLEQLKIIAIQSKMYAFSMKRTLHDCVDLKSCLEILRSSVVCYIIYKFNNCVYVGWQFQQCHPLHNRLQSRRKMWNWAKMYKPYLSTCVSCWQEYKYAGIRVEIMRHMFWDEDCTHIHH